MIVRSRSERRWVWLVSRAGLVLLLLWALGPVFWILVTALKTSKEIYGFPPTFLPVDPTLENFDKALFGSPFPGFIVNSLVVAVSVTLISVVIGALAAYAISRMSFPGRPAAARALVMSYLMPPALLFIPLFLVLQYAGLIDTRRGLVVAYLTFTVPFCTWMLIGYFRTIPRDIDEAARIDGAGALRTLGEIILPLALPGLAVVGLFAFTHAWNEFLFALVYVYSADTQTFTAGLAGLVMGDTYIWGQLMASSIIAILPIFMIYIGAQRFLVEGLAAGSVKG